MSIGNISTVDPKVIEYYDHLSAEWWNETGPLKVIHASTKLLYPYIRQQILDSKLVDQHKVESLKPLAALKILDVGCGGGIATEELAKDGSEAVGLDVGSELLTIAKRHAELNAEITNNISYVLEPIEEHVKSNSEKYDVVIVNYILLCVTDQDFFLKNCIACLKPQGLIFVTTISKSWSSWLFIVLFLEKILGVMPVGLNIWDKYTSPNDLKTILEKYQCNVKETCGLYCNFLKKKYAWSSTTSLDYISYAIKD